MNNSQNFDLIESKIKNYRVMKTELERKRLRLQEVVDGLKEARKDLTTKDVNSVILNLNTERNLLKSDISQLKKQISKEFSQTKDLILKGIDENYSEVYEKQLSRLYETKIDIIVKNMGDDYDSETCRVGSIISTKNKSQHLKIIRTISFGVRDVENNVVTKKAKVEIGYYNKKEQPGTIIPYDEALI